MVAVPVEISFDVDSVLDSMEESRPLVLATVLDVVGSEVLSSVTDELEPFVDVGPTLEAVIVSDELEICVGKDSLLEELVMLWLSVEESSKLEELVMNELELSVIKSPLLEELVESKVEPSVEEGVKLEELLVIDAGEDVEPKGTVIYTVIAGIETVVETVIVLVGLFWIVVP